MCIRTYKCAHRLTTAADRSRSIHNLGAVQGPIFVSSSGIEAGAYPAVSPRKMTMCSASTPSSRSHLHFVMIDLQCGHINRRGERRNAGLGREFFCSAGRIFHARPFDDIDPIVIPRAADPSPHKSLLPVQECIRRRDTSFERLLGDPRLEIQVQSQRRPRCRWLSRC
jgi:hypothetical protein